MKKEEEERKYRNLVKIVWLETKEEKKNRETDNNIT